MKIVHIPNRVYMYLSLVLLSFCVLALFNSTQFIYKHTINTKKIFTHKLLINFPHYNTESYDNLDTYTTTVISNMKTIKGIKRLELQKVSLPFSGQYIHQLDIDINFSNKVDDTKILIDQFCKYNNLVLHDLKPNPSLTKQIYLFMMIIGGMIISGLLYFFITLLQITLYNEYEKVQTLRLIGGHKNMIYLLFHQEIKKIILKSCGFTAIVALLFYIQDYIKIANKTLYWLKPTLYFNVILLPLAVFLLSMIVSKLILKNLLSKEY